MLFRSTCLVFDPGGKQTARYDKIHLFGFKMGAEAYHEERTIEAGVTPVTTDTPFGKLGLSICYDLRFPELYRSMQGVDIIFVPSAFTETTGRAHWETLLRARAIETCEAAERGKDKLQDRLHRRLPRAGRGGGGVRCSRGWGGRGGDG